MDLPPVPPSVRALATSGKLPPELAPLFTPPGQERWGRIAEAVDERLDEVDPAVRGAFALAGAYGHLDDIEFLESGEMHEHNDRAVALIDEALGHGGPDEEVQELWDLTYRVQDAAHLAHDHEEYVAKHGATAEQRLNVKLAETHARHEAGDRDAALRLFREVAEADVWGEFGGAAYRSDIGWCRLLHDAAHHDGPEAARKIWQEAKASRHAARFPYPHWSAPLIEMLLGTGVPDLLALLARERLEAAESAPPWPLDDDELRVLALAVEEIERYDRA
ncbi:hypothetical protein [Amycolatopsis methanolica]|uniref:hypothetical protein n=1 Tax=Amycolatopsis methanolica TaxID=1814 RepID=UPI000366DC6A|nr:hypothetical protein [Amycolatopsis methanolica]